MQVTIQEVTTEFVKKGPKGYTVATVVYSANGKNSTKKIFSFANPQVFDVVKDAISGTNYEVDLKKNGEYWDWVAIKPAGGDAPTAAKPAYGGGKVTGSNYETSEERKLRQMLIVKQSSIGHAVELLTTGAKTPPSVQDVLSVAQEFVDYVYGVGAEENMAKMESAIEDVPY